MNKKEHQAYMAGWVQGKRAAAREALAKATIYFQSGDGNMTTREVAYLLREMSFDMERQASLSERVGKVE